MAYKDIFSIFLSFFFFFYVVGGPRKEIENERHEEGRREKERSPRGPGG